MTNIQPVYPNGILSWTDRTDDVNEVDANDVNTLASDLISVETTLGTTVEIEPSPPVGTPITYSSASARITDAMNNRQMPVSSLVSNSAVVGNTTTGVMNKYVVAYDPYGVYNGNDITIPSDGWWYISASQIWQWWNV